MWKPEDRLAADGIGLRYLSDLTDGKWAIIEPMVRTAAAGGMILGYKSKAAWRNSRVFTQPTRVSQ